jgi:hypothetical protein
MAEKKEKGHSKIPASTETMLGKSGPCGEANLSQSHLNWFQHSVTLKIH